MQNFKPMLFSTNMVQAILNGTKTQTRRIVKKQPLNYNENSIIDRCNFKNGNWCFKHKIENNPDRFEITDLMKSNIEIGDIIWVRETWQNSLNPNEYCYKADTDNPIYLDRNWKWKPSFLMPKEACRIFLKCVSVHVERLQDIDEESALNEGIMKQKTTIKDCNGNSVYIYGATHSEMNGAWSGCHKTAISAFRWLWREIYYYDIWEENPFVWVYTFKVIKRPSNFS